MKWSHILHFVLICVCLCAALVQASRQYHYVADNKTWDEAQTYCRGKYTDLATITGDEDLKNLKNLSSTNKISSRVWIGLYSNTQNGSSGSEKWSESCAGCVVWYNQSWWGVPCNSSFFFVCQTQSPSSGFEVKKQSKTWMDAQSSCHLASKDSLSESGFLANLTGIAVWIDPRHGWIWSDGTKLSFSHWLSNKHELQSGGKMCAVSQQSPDGRGGWDSQNCTGRLPFFCFTAVMTRQVVRVEAKVEDASLNLNDPEILQKLLDQIKAKLKLPADAKLSWSKIDEKVFHKKKD